MKNQIAFNYDGDFLVPKKLDQMIEEMFSLLYVIEYDEAKAEDGKFYVRVSEATVKKALPLYSVEAFKMLFDEGLLHSYRNMEKNWLFYHLIQFNKKFTPEFLEYIYRDGLEKGCTYSLDQALSLVRNSENAKWLIAKGARCKVIPGYGPNTFECIFTGAVVHNDNAVLEAVIEGGVADLDWLLSVNDRGFLNIDTLIVDSHDKEQARFYLRKLLKQEAVKAVRDSWCSVASASKIERVIS